MVSHMNLQWRSPPAPLKYKGIYKELWVGRWMRIPKIDGDLDLSSDSTVFARDTKYLIGAQSTSLNLVGSGGPPVLRVVGGVGLWG